MQRYYPRSFPRLLMIGFTLVALPPVFALVNNAISVDRLANRSQNEVYQAVQATHSSRRLSQLLGALERTARQIVILDDRSLLDAYLSNRRQLEQTFTEFSRLRLDPEQAVALQEIVQGEAEIFAKLSRPGTKGPELKEAVERFEVLAGKAQAIVARSTAQIDREVEVMRATADQAQRITFWQLLALIPVVVFLVIGFSILITRPIRQVDAAIRRLGAGQLRVPVAVAGPEDLEQLGERLEWMRRQLLDLEEQKNRFLRQVSHELKTPLTALREGAELLSEEAVGKLTAEQREISEILRHNSIELQKLIEDLLSFGASQFRKVTVDLEPVELRRVVERVIGDQMLAAKARALSFETAVDDIMLAADPEKLRVVVDNLVSNAIKFSPQGGRIRVVGRLDGNAIELDVIDQGPGIPVGERARIFDPFYQGVRAGAGPVRGTGIGLSVVKEFVFAHGGSVEVVDGGPGTHLQVRLPIEQTGAVI
ncbi:MAG TPA: HAMP domain-containing sensor histidine kinase [Burkholderiales bacterium]|nr:HAMP domain-containing sensor histidine kinase [Burkholderiales bacterium]